MNDYLLQLVTAARTSPSSLRPRPITRFEGGSGFTGPNTLEHEEPPKPPVVASSELGSDPAPFRQSSRPDTLEAQVSSSAPAAIGSEAPIEEGSPVAVPPASQAPTASPDFGPPVETEPGQSQAPKRPTDMPKPAAEERGRPASPTGPDPTTPSNPRTAAPIPVRARVRDGPEAALSPRRSAEAGLAGSGAAAPAPIQITIGRLEVRATPGPAVRTGPSVPAPRTGSVSLEEHLRKRAARARP